MRPLKEKSSSKQKSHHEPPLSFQEDIKAHASGFTFSLASRNGTDDWRFKAAYICVESVPVRSNLLAERAKKPPLLKATKFSLQRFIQTKYAG